MKYEYLKPTAIYVGCSESTSREAFVIDDFSTSLVNDTECEI